MDVFRWRATSLAVALLCLLAGGCSPEASDAELFVGGLRLISNLAATPSHVALADGAEASTDPVLEGLRLRVFDSEARSVLDAPIEGAVRKLALGRSSVAAIEQDLARRVLRIHPFDHGPVVEPEQEGWTMGIAALHDGFLWLEAALVGLEDSDGNGSIDTGVSAFTLVESDEAGTVRSRTLLTMEEPVREPVSLLVPFPAPVDLVVSGDQALFAWDSSAVCGGRATVFRIDRAAATGAVVWRGRSAITGPVEGGTCACAAVEDNFAEAIDAIAFGNPVVVAGRWMRCASVMGGEGFLHDGDAAVAVEEPIGSLAASGGAVLGVAGETVVELDHGAAAPLWASSEELRGVAPAAGRIYAATAHEVFVLPR